jgi:hypothetical protein
MELYPFLLLGYEEICISYYALFGEISDTCMAVDSVFGAFIMD